MSDGHRRLVGCYRGRAFCSISFWDWPPILSPWRRAGQASECCEKACAESRRRRQKRICTGAGVAFLAFSMPHRPLFSLCDPHGRLPQELCLPRALWLCHVLYRAWISLNRERIPTAYFTARSMKIRLISVRRAKTKKTGLLWKQKRWIKYLMMKWETVLLISICPRWAS